MQRRTRSSRTQTRQTRLPIRGRSFRMLVLEARVGSGGSSGVPAFGPPAPTMADAAVNCPLAAALAGEQASVLGC